MTNRWLYLKKEGMSVNSRGRERSIVAGFHDGVQFNSSL